MLCQMISAKAQNNYVLSKLLRKNSAWKAGDHQWQEICLLIFTLHYGTLWAALCKVVNYMWLCTGLELGAECMGRWTGAGAGAVILGFFIIVPHIIRRDFPSRKISRNPSVLSPSPINNVTRRYITNQMSSILTKTIGKKYLATNAIKHKIFKNRTNGVGYQILSTSLGAIWSRSAREYFLSLSHIMLDLTKDYAIQLLSSIFRTYKKQCSLLSAYIIHLWNTLP